jgi:hypothetical protein
MCFIEGHIQLLKSYSADDRSMEQCGMTLRGESQNTRRIRQARYVNVTWWRVGVTISVMEKQQLFPFALLLA